MLKSQLIISVMYPGVSIIKPFLNFIYELENKRDFPPKEETNQKGKPLRRELRLGWCILTMDEISS
jgi:hypothetical protein